MSDDRPDRPDTLEFDPEAVPETLRDREQWVAWRYEWREPDDPDKEGEWSKVPINVSTGGFASSTGFDTWVSFSEAAAYHADDGTDTDGIGFVATDEDVIVGLDLDDCRDPDTGDLDEWTRDLLDAVPTYAEVSPSGTGLRLFGLGFVPEGKTRADVDGAEGHLEMYETGRYFTVTGHHVDGSPEDVRQVNDAIKEVHGEYIADDEPEPPKAAGDGGVEADSPTANPGVSATKPGPAGAVAELTDDELLERATNAENGEYFADLWNGRWQKHAHRWKGDSHSEARQALANLLAFWTGGDAGRMLRLFRSSGLCRGDDDLRTFENYEIPTALEGRTEFYEPGPSDPDEPSLPNDPDPSESEDTATTGDMTLCPADVQAWAGLGEDKDVSDLDDRQKAAVVWDLLLETGEFHIRVRRDNSSLWSYDGGIWQPEGERALRHAARKALGSMNYGQNVLAELKEQARSDPRVEIEPDDLGLETGHVAVENGLINLEAAATGDENAIRELRPDDHALAQFPVEHDPSAPYDEWDSYVEEWAEDGRADALQEYVGYCLHIGEIPIHRALLLVGSGANGKGTFLHVVRALLGRENTTSIELQTLANEKDAVADFYGSVANIDDDLSARKLGAGLGMFKKLVAGDRVRARRLYEDGFEFDAVGKHLYAANEVPDVQVPDEDEAFWRRWLLVEFPNHYPPSERDPDLRDRFTEPEALSGVLNWAIEGWHRLLEQGHFTGEDLYAFEKRERWQAWGDSIDKFITDCIERDEDAENLSTGDVHCVYLAWCEENDVHEPESQQKLTTTLKTENLDYAKSVRPGGTGTPGTGFKSLGFTDEAPEVDDTDRGSGQQPLS